MAEFYLILVVLLVLLAITDLIVGVSNDAVNFLNSSIGSKVASRKVIMMVASVGILVGATFSSGMMEVARKGVFNPEFFFFSEIMVIFIAVMITDIILLDLFNTFGMPTSTTVSIVFELLGAAIAVAVIKILQSGASIDTLDNYINTSSAIVIISGIFLSVLIAFGIGSIVQLFSRLLFTFNIQKRFHWVGGIWSGLALTALTYFLMFKGLKGASFISDDFIALVNSNMFLLLVVTAIIWTIAMHICISIFKINVLKIVVLFGTFTLAMAFAGNDLVNFIGVPIAGLESYLLWSKSGLPASSFEMSVLNQPIRTETYLLVIAGGIMITTLWFSKKARSVTETEINLSRQDEGAERFNSNRLSRSIVRNSIQIGRLLNNSIPKPWLKKINKSFEQTDRLPAEQDDDPPAFDLVRASVNLTVASVLISFATSLKLPLSTTYVSFMVAMGTSLADRAWGRSSAAYRVAGVINVIGGWFMTALIAFTAAALFATLISFLGIYGVIIAGGILIFLVSKTYLLHKKKERIKADQSILDSIDSSKQDDYLHRSSETVVSIFTSICAAYSDAIEGVLHEDRKLLQKSGKEIQIATEKNDALYNELYSHIKKMSSVELDIGRVYVLIFDLQQDILQSASLIINTCSDYVENSLEPIHDDHGKDLIALKQNILSFLTYLVKVIQHSSFEELSEVTEKKRAILFDLEQKLSLQIEGIQSEKHGLGESLLIFRIVLESKDLIAVASRFVDLYHRFYHSDHQPKHLSYQT